MTISTLTEQSTAGAEPISPPEPAMTARQMLGRAEAMRGLLRERQEAAEVAGNIAPDTNQALVDAGFYRVVQPRRFGGYGFDLPTYVKLVTAIARGCPETAWVLSLTLGHVHQLASFPLAAQREAYGPSGDFRAPEVGAPQGQGIPSPGGYRVSGAWDYASGSEYATHILLVFTIKDPEPGGVSMRMGLFQRGDYDIIRNWDVIGMQGTGSDRVVMKDVFVPADHSKPYPEPPLARQMQLPREVYGGNPLFYGPARPFIITESAAVVVGAAEGALDVYEETFIARKAMGPTPVARYELAEYQLNFGRCRALADTARAAILQAASDYMEIAQETCTTGEPCSEDRERRLTLVILQSIHLAYEAVDIMFRTAGSSAAKKNSALGRYWRNISVLRGHLAHQSDSAAINYGRTHFGLAPVGIA